MLIGTALFRKIEPANIFLYVENAFPYHPLFSSRKRAQCATLDY